jgi:AcrR family transcriptional regulator
MYIEAMPAPVAAPKHPRRTQAERRATTRAAILDAAIECLVEEGYADTTTRRIAERAGVTPGALQHHFTSKAELLSEAVRHVRGKFAQEMFAKGPPDAPTVDERSEQLLDRMWELHMGPLFHASTELLVAARTDPELRATLAEVQHEVAALNAAAIPILFPEMADEPGFAQLIDTGQAAIRGLALLAFIDPAEAEKAWPSTRAHIIALSADYVEPSGP